MLEVSGQRSKASPCQSLRCQGQGKCDRIMHIGHVQSIGQSPPHTAHCRSVRRRCVRIGPHLVCQLPNCARADGLHWANHTSGHSLHVWCTTRICARSCSIFHLHPRRPLRPAPCTQHPVCGRYSIVFLAEFCWGCLCYAYDGSHQPSCLATGEGPCPQLYQKPCCDFSSSPIGGQPSRNCPVSWSSRSNSIDYHIPRCCT